MVNLELRGSDIAAVVFLVEYLLPGSPYRLVSVLHRPMSIFITCLDKKLDRSALAYSLASLHLEIVLLDGNWYLFIAKLAPG